MNARLNVVVVVCSPEYMVVPVPYKSIVEVVDILTSRLTDFCQMLLRPSASGGRGRQSDAGQQKDGLLQTVCSLATALCACIHQLTRFCVH